MMSRFRVGWDDLFEACQEGMAGERSAWLRLVCVACEVENPLSVRRIDIFAKLTKGDGNGSEICARSSVQGHLDGCVMVSLGECCGRENVGRSWGRVL